MGPTVRLVDQEKCKNVPVIGSVCGTLPDAGSTYTRDARPEAREQQVARDTAVCWASF